jgi:hypothetical protein
MKTIFALYFVAIILLAFVPCAAQNALTAKAIEDKEPQITAQFKTLLQNLAAGTADPNLFTEAAKAKFFPNVAKELGDGIKELGTPEKMELIRRLDQDEYRSYRYRVIYQEANLIFDYVLDKSGKSEINLPVFASYHRARLYCSPVKPSYSLPV